MHHHMYSLTLLSYRTLAGNAMPTVDDVGDDFDDEDLRPEDEDGMLAE